MNAVLRPLTGFYFKVRSLGVTPSLDDYEKRKLAIFNILNCMGLMNGIIIPIAGFFSNDNLPPLAWIVAFSPAFISSAVLYVIRQGKHEQAKMIYFIFYPLLTSLAYATQIDVGIELFFIVYAVLAVFLLQKVRHAVISFAFSLSLYFAVSVIWNQYDTRLVDLNPGFFFFNHLLAVIFIFCSLYLFKTENHAYQLRLRQKNGELENKNIEIDHQRQELKELDNLKNKLFSVIAHDLKTPMYALRNLFRNVQSQNMSGEEIKMIMPDVVNDLNYTTGLMENLLQWAKSQMQSDAVKLQTIDLTAVIREVMQLLRLQAESKKIYLECKTDAPVYVHADKDMINLVLRNLLSNAIKFTPESGNISIGTDEADDFVEVFVQDSGMGMSEDALQKINANNYFTTKGTANESGTGLGLMLCKEFLAKNGGRMFVESEPGQGSVFSFTLPMSH